MPNGELNHIDETVSMRSYFERIMQEQKEARQILSTETSEAARIAESEREKAAANVRRGLEEHMSMGDARLQDHIDHQVEQVKQALTSLNLLIHERDGRMDDRFLAFREAIEKADAAMGTRLESMNAFRTQIDRERSSYVTRDFVDEREAKSDGRIGRLENWQGKIIGGLMVVSAIGITNFMKVWTG